MNYPNQYARVNRPNVYSHTAVPNTRFNASSSTSTRNRPTFKLWVLTIAINNYLNPKYPSLRGCEADAADLETYLMSDLGVPPGMIRRLRNEYATRDAILKEFDNFARDSRIEYGDPILIYFAGHGGETRIPSSDGGGDIQFLIPHDCEMLDSSRLPIHGIPDFLIGQKLKYIAEKKGNNITLIFDSCHSGSSVRDADGDVKFRTIRYRAGVPPEFAAFKNLLRGQNGPYASVPVREAALSRIGGFGTSPTCRYPNGLVWHSVLLAACSSQEEAREQNGRGLFTRELLKTMRSLGSDLSSFTYKELFRRIPPFDRNQNPQCEGDHGDRFIFRKDIKPAAAPPKPTLPAQSNKLPDLVFYIPQESVMEKALEAFRSLMRDSARRGMANFAPATHPDLARFVLSFNHQSRCFEIMNNETHRKLSRTLTRGATTEDFKVVFQGIASYHFYLQYSNQNLRDQVSLRVFKASGDGKARGQNLVREDMCIDIAEDGSNFVVQLQNMTSRNLYPVLFCFNEDDFSIRLLYQPPSIPGMQRVDHPLRAKSILPIGDDRTDPQHLISRVRDGHDVEIGYLKLFVSTEYIDLSGIEQESPMIYSPRLRGMKQQAPRLPTNIVYGTTVHFIVRSKGHNGQLRAHKASVPVSREPVMNRTHQLYHPPSGPLEDLQRKMGNMTMNQNYGVRSSTESTTRGVASTRKPERDEGMWRALREIDEELRAVFDNVRGITEWEQRHSQDLKDIRDGVNNLRRSIAY